MTKTAITRERLQEIAEDGFLKHGESKELARMALAAIDSEPVIADCDPEVYEKGVSVCLVAIPKETAEIICQNITAATGCKVDWHYFGGRVHIKALRESSQPAPEYPEVLPCPVLLEPGLRFGKGIKTSTVLAALARRAVYESDMAELSPEERAEFQAGIEDFKALIAKPAPVVPAVSDDIGEIRVGRLPTMNQDDYPGLGDWWVQLRTVEVHYVVPPGYVVVPKEPTDEMIAAAMNCEDVLFNSDDSFCVQFVNIYEAMLAAAPKEVK